MLKACPVSGPEDKFLSVWVSPTARRRSIPPHFHKRHTMLYYPEPAELTIDGKPERMAAGEIIYLKPRTLHELLHVKQERFSCAMLISGK